MTASPTTPARTGSAGTPAGGLVAVFLVAACLRTAITCVGPLLGRIGDDTGLSDTLLGLLGALPLLAFAAVSPVVQGLARRTGSERLIAWALLALAAGIALRSVPVGTALWAGTAVLGAGIAVGNVLLPAVVRRDHAGRAALIVGAYSAVMGTAASIASGVALPLASALHSWRWSLAVWFVPALAAGLVWLGRRPVPPAPAPDGPVAPRRPVWRSPLAWRLTAFMGLQSTAFYVMVSWLPSILARDGFSHAVAGWLLFGYQVVGLLAGLLVPVVLRRVRPHTTAALSAVPLLVGAGGLALAPSVAPLWIVVAGVGSGASLVIALSLFSLDSDGPAHAAALSGMAQSLGYLLAAGGPVSAGALRDATGSWTPALVGLAALAVVQGAVIVSRRAAASR